MPFLRRMSFHSVSLSGSYKEMRNGWHAFNKHFDTSRS